MQIYQIFPAMKRRLKAFQTFSCLLLQFLFIYFVFTLITGNSPCCCIWHRQYKSNIVFFDAPTDGFPRIPARSFWSYFWANLCPCRRHVLHVPQTPPVYQRGRTWNVCLWLCACVECTLEGGLLELLSELITKTASNDGTKKLSMDSLSWLDSLSQLQNHLPLLW